MGDAVAAARSCGFFLTNVSSTRVFNLSFAAARTARMKVVASDLGRYEREAWVDNVTIAPAERYVVDVRFDEPGDVSLVNRVRAIDHMHGALLRGDAHARRRARVRRARHARSAASVRAPAPRTRTSPPTSTGYRPQFGARWITSCVITLETGDLPFPLRPLMQFRVGVSPSGGVERDDAGDGLGGHRHGRRDGFCASGTTARENMDIHWRFRVGDVVKLRLVNDRSALHAMQHPIHIHGQRFLVLSVNGVPNEQPGVERHGARADRLRGRRAAGAVESRQVDAALPRRRAHRDRHADGVRGRAMNEERTHDERSLVLAVVARSGCARRAGVSSLSPDVAAVVSVPETRVALTHVRVVDGTGRAAARGPDAS